MALDLKPLKWDWACVVKGDTFPSTTITETLADTTLTRVRIKIKAVESSETSLTFDSDSTGVTINSGTPGAWSFTIAAIPTITLTAGFYRYDLETTDSANTIRTEFSGTWEIIDQVTD